jgi:surfactin family lipopeptide synthetase C
MKNVSDIYPLSPMQELMLVHSLSRPGNDLLFNQIVYSLTGDLDSAIFENCWGDLVERHPMLRTLFLWEGLKSPMQVVREKATLSWENYDWRGLSNDEQNARL